MRTALLVLSFCFATSLHAGDAWLPIAGSVNNFRTDARILNLSNAELEVSAYFLPTDTVANVAIVSGPPVKFSIPARSMKVYDDVVATLFNTTGIGAILFTAPSAFEASSRIYATVGNGTLGQFSAAKTPGQAFFKGAVFQLKSNVAFRTNIGAATIANADTAVTWSLYDRNNVKVATATRTFAAYEVMRPTSVVQLFPDAAAADLGDAWVSYVASNPLFVYGSVVDNVTTDPTFIPAVPDL